MKKILLGGSPCTFWSVAQRSKKKVAKSNHPEIVEMGDAYQVRGNWRWENKENEKSIL